MKTKHNNSNANEEMNRVFRASNRSDFFFFNYRYKFEWFNGFRCSFCSFIVPFLRIAQFASVPICARACPFRFLFARRSCPLFWSISLRAIARVTITPFRGIWVPWVYEWHCHSKLQARHTINLRTHRIESHQDFLALSWVGVSDERSRCGAKKKTLNFKWTQTELNEKLKRPKKTNKNCWMRHDFIAIAGRASLFGLLLTESTACARREHDLGGQQTRTTCDFTIAKSLPLSSLVSSPQRTLQVYGGDRW